MMFEKNKEKRTYIQEMISEARSLSHHGKMEEALECYDKIIEKYPEEISAIYGKGMIYFEFGKFKEALNHFEKALKRDPRDINSLYAKGSVLSNLSRPAEALELFNKVLELDPAFHSAWVAKGFAFFELEKFEEALECFQKAEKLGLRDTALAGKGHTLRKLTKLKKAIACYQAVLAKDPYDSEALLGLGIISLEENNLKQALNYLQKSVTQNEESLEVWESLAEVFKRMKDSKREAIALEKIAEFKNEN